MREPHVRGRFGWLRSGPLYRFHVDQAPDLDTFLAEHDFLRIDLDGTAIHDRDSAHALLGRAFAFPDWCGHNWDAFNDCFGGFVHDHDGARVAVVWHDLEASARRAPVTTTEVGWALLEQATRHRWPESGRASLRMELFALGEGPDFDRPVD